VKIKADAIDGPANSAFGVKVGFKLSYLDDWFTFHQQCLARLITEATHGKARSKSRSALSKSVM
jgi:hypothetical protein